MTATCPQCGTAMAVPEDLLGDEIECPKCSRAFSAPLPEFEDDDRPQRRPRRRNRRRDAEAILKPCGITLIVVTVFRIVLNGLCATGTGFAVLQGGVNPGSAIVVGITAVCFLLNGLTLVAAWQLLTARSYGWGLTAGILSVIPTLDVFLYCFPWVIELGVGIWAIVVVNQPDVRWLIQQNQDVETLDHD